MLKMKREEEENESNTDPDFKPDRNGRFFGATFLGKKA